MFVADEVLLDLQYPAARDKLARFVRGGLLAASREAHDDEAAGLHRVGAAGLWKLVAVQVSELPSSSESSGVAIRWQAIGPGSALFPVLDADVTLSPADEQHTLLTLTGAYRPPLGDLGARIDRAVMHRLAAATIRTFLGRLAEGLSHDNGITEAATAEPGQP
jgi:hypothetical protein